MSLEKTRQLVREMAECGAEGRLPLSGALRSWFSLAADASRELNERALLDESMISAGDLVRISGRIADGSTRAFGPVMLASRVKGTAAVCTWFDSADSEHAAAVELANLVRFQPENGQ